MATGWRGEWPPPCVCIRCRDALGCPFGAPRRDLEPTCDGMNVQASCGLFGVLLQMVLQKGCVLDQWPKGHCSALGTLAGPQGLVAGGAWLFEPW